MAFSTVHSSCWRQCSCFSAILGFGAVQCSCFPAVFSFSAVQCCCFSAFFGFSAVQCSCFPAVFVSMQLFFIHPLVLVGFSVAQCSCFPAVLGYIGASSPLCTQKIGYFFHYYNRVPKLGHTELLLTKSIQFLAHFGILFLISALIYPTPMSLTDLSLTTIALIAGLNQLA